MTDRIANTFQINFVCDICSCACVILISFYELNQVEEGEYKYPNQIYKVPIKSYFFNHFIMSSSFISANNHIKKDDDIDDYAR